MQIVSVSHFLHRWRQPLGGVVAGLAVIVSAHGASPGQAPTFDPLERASNHSPRASSALMTSVTRAGSRLVAVGERGTVLTSDDSGNSWTQRLSPVSVMLTNVRFASDKKGWAVGHGGVILVTADGGVTWRKQLDGVGAAVLILNAARETTGAAGNKAVTEAERLVADGPDKPFFALLVDDERTVTVVGAYGLVLRTVDGGANWHPWSSRIPNAKGSHLYAIERGGPAIYLAGEQGSVFRSTDNGQSFIALRVPYSGSFFGVTSTDTDRVMVFGLRGHAYVSADGGASWAKRAVGTSASLTAGIALEDGSTVIVSQAGNVLRSIDGDASFNAMPVTQPVPFVGVVQAADGGLVMAGVRGMTRSTLTLQDKKP